MTSSSSFSLLVLVLVLGSSLVVGSLVGALVDSSAGTLLLVSTISNPW